ncbi:MAG: zf-HC2 domain-containing protein, partial [Actinomycetota bacterium]|nr:zf-HC2 domain-containing protein [Actinomycetota bacterium]
MTRHEDLQRSLGSYVFGSLDPAERTELESHLATCAPCRQELASLAGLPGLLGRLSLQEATGSDLLPPPSLLPRVLAAVESERGGRRQRLRRWQAATAALAVAAAAAAVLVLAPDLTGPAPRSLVAAAGVPAT